MLGKSTLGIMALLGLCHIQIILHLGLCHIRDHVTFGIMLFGIMSFRIMSHSGLCVWDYVKFGIMSSSGLTLIHTALGIKLPHKLKRKMFRIVLSKKIMKTIAIPGKMS